MKVNVTTRKRKRCTAVMLDYFDLEGRRHQEVFDRAVTAKELAAVRKQAQHKARQIELALLEGRFKPKLGQEPTDAILAEFGEHAERCHYKPKTKTHYRYAIRKFRRFLQGRPQVRRAKDVTPRLIVEYVHSEKGRGIADNTIIVDLAHLGRIFQRAVERGTMVSNPCRHPDVKDVKPKMVPHERAFTDAELAAFLDGVSMLKGRHRESYRQYFLLLAETGMRLTEGLRLRWCDVHFERGGSYLRIEAHDGWEPKTKAGTRTIPLTPRVEAMLRARLVARDTVDPTVAVFPPTWSMRWIDTVFNKVLREVGLAGLDGKGQKLRVHSLRHYYATRLVHSGADPAAARDLLGHASIVQTNRYFNVPRGELFRATQQAFARPMNAVTAPGDTAPIPMAVGASQETSQIPADTYGPIRTKSGSATIPAFENPRK